MNFLEAFESPVVEKIGGIDITFPVLSIDDYSQWIAELTSARKQIAKAAIPRSIDPATKLPTLANPAAQWNINQRIESIAIGLEDVAQLIWTYDGAIRVLKMSLGKAGLSEEDQRQVLSRIKPVRLHLLAVEVSGLFESRESPESSEKPTEGQPDPNGSSPAETIPTAGAATGS